MFENLYEVEKMQQKTMDFSEQALAKYRLIPGEEFPFVSAYMETLPHGLIGDEI
jgi:hypothetical protein